MAHRERMLVCLTFVVQAHIMPRSSSIAIGGFVSMGRDASIHAVCFPGVHNDFHKNSLQRNSTDSTLGNTCAKAQAPMYCAVTYPQAPALSSKCSKASIGQRVTAAHKGALPHGRALDRMGINQSKTMAPRERFECSWRQCTV